MFKILIAIKIRFLKIKIQIDIRDFNELKKENIYLKKDIIYFECVG